MIAKIRTSPTRPMDLMNIMLQPSRLGGLHCIGFGGIESLLHFALQAIQITNRDNWIYLNFGDVHFAYQIWRKNKSIRKEPHEGNSREPVATG